MKRFHVHLSVRNLSQSIAFYSRLFGAGPAVLKNDYRRLPSAVCMMKSLGESADRKPR